MKNMIVATQTGGNVNVCFKALQKSDIPKYKLYRKNGWFKWNNEFAVKENNLFGMFIKGKNEIQGVIIQIQENNQLIHVQLMETAPHNKYSHTYQTYSGIGKNLLCFAIDLSFRLNFEGYVGLFAKRNQNEDYYRKLGAIQARFSYPPYYYFPTDTSAKLLKRYLPGGVHWCQN